MNVAADRDTAAGAPDEEAVVTPDLTDLMQSPGFAMRMTQLRLFQMFYDELFHHGLSPGAATVLRAISKNPGVHHGTLADALMIRRPNMTTLVNRLAEGGLIERRINKNDRRKVALFLSDKGREWIEAFEADAATHNERTFSALTSQERETFMRLMHKLVDGLPVPQNGSRGRDWAED